MRAVCGPLESYRWWMDSTSFEMADVDEGRPSDPTDADEDASKHPFASPTFIPSIEYEGEGILFKEGYQTIKDSRSHAPSQHHINQQSVNQQSRSKEQPRSAVTPKYQRWNPFKDTFLLFLLVDFFRCFFLGEDLAHPFLLLFSSSCLSQHTLPKKIGLPS